MIKDQSNVINQNVENTIIFDSQAIKSGQLRLIVNAYPLLESEFEKLTSTGAGLMEWSQRFLLISIGAVIVLLAKVIDFYKSFSEIHDKSSISIEIKEYEMISIVISIGLWLLLLLVSLFFKNKKDYLISKIKNHFNSERADKKNRYE